MYYVLFAYNVDISTRVLFHREHSAFEQNHNAIALMEKDTDDDDTDLVTFPKAMR